MVVMGVEEENFISICSPPVILYHTNNMCGDVSDRKNKSKATAIKNQKPKNLKKKKLLSAQLAGTRATNGSW